MWLRLEGENGRLSPKQKIRRLAQIFPSADNYLQQTAVYPQSCYNSHMAIEKVARKIKIDEQEPDSVYWRTQSYQARLAALEQIRQEYHQWKYGTRRPRLQRVYTIIKQ